MNHCRKGGGILLLVLLSLLLLLMVGLLAFLQVVPSRGPVNKGFRVIPSSNSIIKGERSKTDIMLNGDSLNASVLLSMDENHELFSGYGQDRTVYSLLASGRFNGNGFFVDLAARHPFETSNSRALERELGWSGLCIEGNKGYWDQLAALRNCTTVAAVVADQFYASISFADGNKGRGGIVVGNSENVTMVSDVDGRLRQHNQQTKRSSTYVVNQLSTTQAVPFHTILDALNVPSTIDYLSLDVEGAEDLVLSSSFPLDRYKFTLLSIEGPFGENSSASLAILLRSKGYRWLCQNDGGRGRVIDSLWAHESFQEPSDFDASKTCVRNCQSAIEGYKKYGLHLSGDPCVL